MGLFDRKNKAINQLSNNPLQTFTSGLKRMWAMAPKRDKMELVDLAHKSPRLDPIFIIARAVAGTEWNTYNKIDIKKNGKTAAPVFNEDIMSLLDYPIRRYPEIDWYALCYSTVAVVKAVGEYGWLKVRDERNKVIELNPIPPGWIMRTPTVGDPFYTIYPFGATAGVAIRVSPDDFIYFKRPDLNDPYGRGRGDSEQLEDEFEIDEYAGKAQKNLLFNDATPPFIVQAPGATPDKADEIKKGLMQKMAGYMHRREPAVIGWDAKIQTVGMSPLEMDMMESRKFIRDEIYMHYQIPPEIYGNIQNSNRSTITSAEYLFHKNALNTEYRFFERQITRQLIAVDFDKNLCFRFDDVVPDDEDFKLQVLNAGLTGGVVQVDEWRKAFDLPELPNNKGKVFLRTFAQYEVPADGKDPELPPDKPSGQTEDKPTDDDLLKPEDLGLDAESAKSFKIVDYSTEKVSIVHKYNENHDPDTGQFTSGDGGSGSGDGDIKLPPMPGDDGYDYGEDSDEYLSRVGELYPNVEKERGTNIGNAINSYSKEYRDVREYLISGELANKPDPSYLEERTREVENIISGIDEHISNNILAENITLYRGLRANDATNMEVGSIMQYKGFQSFSDDISIATGRPGANVLLRLDGKKSDPIAPTGDLSAFSFEHEYIGARDTSYEIAGKSTENGITVFDIRVKK